MAALFVFGLIVSSVFGANGVSPASQHPSVEMNSLGETEEVDAHAQVSKRLMRRETKRGSIIPNGAFVDMEPSAAGAAAQTPSSTQTLIHEQEHNPEHGECNDDFVYGNPNSRSCDSANMDRIDNKDMCNFAATQAGLHTPGYPDHPFEIPIGWYDERPAGCFKFACSENQDGDCFFFNPGIVPASTLPDMPDAHRSGTPVCHRKRYDYGTPDTNDCDEGYSRILDGMACRAAASCLGECTGAAFEAHETNMSKYHEYPLGCFINDADGCYYYNQPEENVDGPETDLDWLPSSPKGKIVCKVTKNIAAREAELTAAAAAAAPRLLPEPDASPEAVLLSMVPVGISGSLPKAVGMGCKFTMPTLGVDPVKKPSRSASPNSMSPRSPSCSCIAYSLTQWDWVTLRGSSH